MKFSCNVAVLKSALDIVGRTIDSRPFNTMLLNVKMVLTEDSLLVTGSDLKTAIATKIPVESSDSGEFCIPYDFLKQVVSKIDRNQEISLDIDDEFNVLIKWSKGKFQYKAIAADDFPEFPEIESDRAYTLPESVIEHLRFASRYASKDETKQVLTGVNVSIADNILHAIATDGKRLGYSSGELKSDDFMVTIPGSAVAILKVAADGNIEFKFDDSQILFITGDTRIAARIPSGQYPDALRLIPAEFKHEITMNGSELKAALDRVAITCGDTRNVALQFGEGVLAKVESFSCSGDTGSASEEVVASIIDEPFRIAIHHPYLVSALPDGEFTLHVNQPNTPAVVKDGDRLVLIMPVQIRDY